MTLFKCAYTWSASCAKYNVVMRLFILISNENHNTSNIQFNTMTTKNNLRVLLRMLDCVYGNIEH
ncbi:hypothetical protein DPMN_096828 [Dreissena polymorpha]|uniref:Uncharacterized protein n=1 Tax=Dreissena polymorpha TaxID=45954 RepID=A0A9D4LC49_DREPO|nr:hypothetical protein DPMN_096828 [Dreissena polymorpha]